VSIKIDHGFTASDDKMFMVRFRLEVWISHEPPTRLEVSFVSEFESGKALTDEDRQSHFVRRNAPAIAFPFLRSYVAHITLLAGYKPLILAPLNFAKDSTLEPGEDPSFEPVWMDALRRPIDESAFKLESSDQRSYTPAVIEPKPAP
jgi:preprotein translocase subunit SecB